MICTYGGFVHWDTLTNSFIEPNGNDPNGTPFIASTSTCQFPEVTDALNEFWSLFVIAIGVYIVVVLTIGLWNRR